jgi:hypothetical protein
MCVCQCACVRARVCVCVLARACVHSLIMMACMNCVWFWKLFTMVIKQNAYIQCVVNFNENKNT